MSLQHITTTCGRSAFTYDSIVSSWAASVIAEFSECALGVGLDVCVDGEHHEEHDEDVGCFHGEYCHRCLWLCDTMSKEIQVIEVE